MGSLIKIWKTLTLHFSIADRNIMKVFRVIPVFFLCLSSMQSSFAKDVPLNELIDRVLERSELIKSGIFRVAAYDAESEDIIISDNADLDLCEAKVEYAPYQPEHLLRQPSWLLIMRGTEWSFSLDQNSYEDPFLIVKENYEANYVEGGTRPDGEVGRLLSVSPKKSDISDFFVETYTFLGAGRIPTLYLRNYIRKHKEDARDFGSVVLANGDVARQIQFTIPKRYYGVLREHTVAGLDIWDFDTMLLNIYVVPEKGYVVRRIDECLPDGTVKVRYDSLDFIDRGNGIYFPNRFVVTYVWGKRNSLIVRKYEILEVSLLNEEIPDRYFDRQLVKGTTISDRRLSALGERGSPRYFTTFRDGFASELDVFYEEWQEAVREARQRREAEKQLNKDVPDIDSKIVENIPGNYVSNSPQRSLTVFLVSLTIFCVISLLAVLYWRFVLKR